MTTIIMLAVLGMAVTVVAPKITNTAKNANARTARTRLRAMHVSKISRRDVALRNSKATATATTTTIMVVAIGTMVTAADQNATLNIAKSASARIAPRQNPRSVPARRKAVSCPNTRRTRTATTRTTIADALGTEVTVVPRPTMAVSTRSIARFANAWTLIINKTLTAKGVVVRLNTKAMATATTKTTTALASTTAAIVARNHSGGSLSTRNTANNANAWTRRISKVPTAKGVVVRRNTRAMATATTKTTSAVATTTAAIVARNQPRSLLTRNTANNANAWTRRISLTNPPTNPNVTKAKINVVR